MHENPISKVSEALRARRPTRSGIFTVKISGYGGLQGAAEFEVVIC